MSVEEGKIRSIVREEIEKGLSIKASTKPTIFNKTMKVENTEYEIPLPPKTKKYTMHLRTTDVAFIYAYEKGRVDTATPKGPYFTVPAGYSKFEENLNVDRLSIFVACVSAGKVVEIEAWS